MFDPPVDPHQAAGGIPVAALLHVFAENHRGVSDHHPEGLTWDIKGFHHVDLLIPKVITDEQSLVDHIRELCQLADIYDVAITIKTSPPTLDETISEMGFCPERKPKRN